LISPIMDCMISFIAKFLNKLLGDIPKAEN
jgi:hypothetical protein